jgi:group II intron reverse transcriptase/maturase
LSDRDLLDRLFDWNSSAKPADQLAVADMQARIEDKVQHNGDLEWLLRNAARRAARPRGTRSQRCWKNPWVIDLDIKGFFDSIDHGLLMRAVKQRTSSKWVLLYVERWLKAGVIEEDGRRRSTVLGTPQGGVISPLLGNLFLHYVFDAWMVRHYPNAKFECYADDIIVHCRYLGDAQRLLRAIERRMKACELTLHPEKTKIVFCRNLMKPNEYGYPESFDFLGFTFRQRTTRREDGTLFDGFLPAISQTSRKRISRQIRKWRLGRATSLSLQQLSKEFNPALRGWVNYFGKFYPQALKPIRQQWHNALIQWAIGKYRRFGEHRGTTGEWVHSIERRNPQLFAVWELFYGS